MGCIQVDVCLFPVGRFGKCALLDRLIPDSVLL